jgi:hypothetical protein
MSMADLMAQDQRLALLLTLQEDPDFRANDDVLKRMLSAIGHGITRDMLRAHLAWLEEHRLVRIERMPLSTGELWVAQLLEDGQDVARGRPHPGVARPLPR